MFGPSLGTLSAIVNDSISSSAAPQSKFQAPLGIVTVTYSPGDYLGRFLGSISPAVAQGAHVVLADNGSTDGVPQATADKLDWVQFLDTGGNLGYGGGMNAGAQALRAARDAGEIDQEYVLLSNPDVEFTPGSIDKLIACAKRWDNAGAVGPRIVEPDGSNYPSARAVPTVANGIGHALLGNIWPDNPWSKAYRDEEDMSSERPAGWLSGSCVLVRWSAFDAIGGFDERYFMYLEDIDLGDRFSRAGYVNVFCPSACITHAKGHSTSANSKKMLRAHHESAYRFIADRYPGAWQAPLRGAVKFGLAIRSLLVSS